MGSKKVAPLDDVESRHCHDLHDPAHGDQFCIAVKGASANGKTGEGVRRVMLEHDNEPPGRVTRLISIISLLRRL